MKKIYGNAPFMSLTYTMITTLVLSLFISIPSAVAAPGSQKTGVVDVSKVISQMPETKKAENILKATSSQWEQSFKKMKTSYETALAGYQKKAKGMTKAQREQKEKELSQKLKELQKFQMDKFGPGGALDKKKAELFAPIRQKLIKTVQTIAQKEGFSVILDKQALIWGDSAHDITFKVINKIK